MNLNQRRPPLLISWLGKILPVIVLAMLAVATGLVAWNWTYIDRILTYPAGQEVTDVPWYEPKELVQGAPGVELPGSEPEENAVPGAPPEPLAVSTEALAAATAWAASSASSAFT